MTLEILRSIQAVLWCTTTSHERQIFMQWIGICQRHGGNQLHKIAAVANGSFIVITIITFPVTIQRLNDSEENISLRRIANASYPRSYDNRTRQNYLHWHSYVLAISSRLYLHAICPHCLTLRYRGKGRKSAIFDDFATSYRNKKYVFPSDHKDSLKQLQYVNFRVAEEQNNRQLLPNTVYVGMDMARVRIPENRCIHIHKVTHSHNLIAKTFQFRTKLPLVK